MVVVWIYKHEIFTLMTMNIFKDWIFLFSAIFINFITARLGW